MFEYHEQEHVEKREKKFEDFVREQLAEDREILEEILEEVKPHNTVTGGIIRQVA